MPARHPLSVVCEGFCEKNECSFDRPKRLISEELFRIPTYDQLLGLTKEHRRRKLIIGLWTIFLVCSFGNIEQ